METLWLNSQTHLEGSRNLHPPMFPAKIFPPFFLLAAKGLGLQAAAASLTTFKGKEFILRI